MRVLATIPHFYRPDGSQLYASRYAPRREKAEALRLCLAHLRMACGERVAAGMLNRAERVDAGAAAKADLTIVICVQEPHHVLTDAEAAEFGVEVRHVEGDPRFLGYACHEVMAERSDEFDWFCYMEDDLLLRDVSFFAKQTWFHALGNESAVLQPHRYEMSRSGKLYIDGELDVAKTAPYQDLSEAKTLTGDYLGREVAFQRTTNPHSGCFFLSQGQWKQWQTAPYFGDRDESFFSPLEGAASIGLMRTFQVYKPSWPNSYFLEIEHYGDNWTKKFEVRDSRAGRGEKNGVADSSDRPPRPAAKPGLWAINYHADAFRRGGKKLMGRQVAGERFLQALARAQGAGEMLGFAAESMFGDFAEQIATASQGRMAARWVSHEAPEALAEADVLYHPSVGIGEWAWRRRRLADDAYSLIGVTHTMSSQRVAHAVADFVEAPLCEWDALVCASQSVAAVVEQMLAARREFLAELTGGCATTRLHLPVIPLGVDCAEMQQMRGGGEQRAAARKKLGVADDEIVFLYVGRLSFHAKANPKPIYASLAAAAGRAKAKVRLLLAGWFASGDISQAFHAAVDAYCPNIKVQYTDGRRPDKLAAAWAAADAFTLLVDNIQESFGLAPIEAMAAGLPVVVSDWNGFRDTVRDGVDGFRVRTVTPREGAELFLDRYVDDVDDYDHYIGSLSNLVTVDYDAAAVAYERLIKNPDLRRRMGEEGRRRARNLFDWQVVVGQYQALAEELRRRRKAATEPLAFPAFRRNPKMLDPLTLFGHFASCNFGEDNVLFARTDTAETELEALDRDALMQLGRKHFSGRVSAAKVLEGLRQGPQSVRYVLDGPLSDVPRPLAMRTLARMTKFGLVEVR